MAKKTTNQQTSTEELASSIPQLNPDTVEEAKESPLELAPTPLETLSPLPMNGIPEKIKEEPLSTDEKIVGFLKARNTGGFIPINDFLKSIYGPGMPNSPKAWYDQRTMKLLKIMIEKLVKDGIVVVEGNFHQRLGRPYDPDGTPGVTHYHNLDTLILKAKLA